MELCFGAPECCLDAPCNVICCIAAKESLNLMFEEVAKKVKGTQQQQQKAIEDKINKQKKDILALYKSRGRLLWVRDTNNGEYRGSLNRID